MSWRRLDVVLIVADSEADLARGEAELVAEGHPVALVSEQHQRAYLVATTSGKMTT